MLNTLFLEGVPDERQNEPVPGSAIESLRTPFTGSSLLSESLEQAEKDAASIFSLKKIHPQGTRDSAEGIRTNYRWARV